MVRLKTRYLVVEATGARKLAVKKEDIAALIRESITKSYGDFGSGLAQYAFQVLYYNTHTRLAAIRCAREMCKMVETSLVFVTEAHSQDVSVRVARVCGSSRTCREHLLKLSLERAKTLNLYTSQPDFNQEVEAEIALVDPQ
ncbi:rpp14 family protein [Phytophthora cinnamomi]|uniref:rpp14 family protein n=1 Tax=Phytophthora cinnamomi TaxID=4785 RepID=UPI00355AA8FF|nr:rpp14 family protein [Phytophthora cinnamomi]